MILTLGGREARGNVNHEGPFSLYSTLALLVALRSAQCAVVVERAAAARQRPRYPRLRCWYDASGLGPGAARASA